MKTLEERYGNEIWSDNSDQCEQCKDCVFRDRDNYKKGICQMYPDWPNLKPNEVMQNKEKCAFYEKE